MEGFHHGLTPEPSELSDAGRAMLAYGVDSLGKPDFVGRSTTQQAIIRAEEILAGFSDGILDTDLMIVLEKDMSIPSWIAVLAVDSLSSSDKVIFDDATKIMRPTV